MPLKTFLSFFKSSDSTNNETQWPEALLTDQQQTQKSDVFHSQYNQINDPQASLDLCKKAADEGVVDALYLLGVLYENGDGKQSFLQQAAECYWRAASQGKVEAQYNLALMYTQGMLGQEDYISAFHWFEKAAEGGVVQAQYNLANCHDQALGCLGDKTKAYHWYMKAAEQGFIRAWQNIAVMYYQGEGISKDVVKAYAWTLLAAKAGQEESIAAEPILTEALSAEEIIDGKVLLDTLFERYKTHLPKSDTNNVINQFYDAAETHSDHD